MFDFKRLISWIESISSLGGWFGKWLVLICCVVSAGNAVLRYTLNIGSNAWLEAQWYMFAGMVMLGAAYTLKSNEHIRIDLFYGRMRPRVRAWVDLLGTLFFLMPMAILLSWLSWHFFAQAWRMGEVSNNAGGLILWPAKLLLPLGFVMLAVQGIAEIIKRIGMLFAGDDLNTQYEKPLQ